MSESKVVPCCGYKYEDADYPVKWNPWNKVVQCHNCGATWLPITAPAETVAAQDGPIYTGKELEHELASLLRKHKSELAAKETELLAFDRALQKIGMDLGSTDEWADQGAMIWDVTQRVEQLRARVAEQDELIAEHDHEHQALNFVDQLTKENIELKGELKAAERKLATIRAKTIEECAQMCDSQCTYYLDMTDWARGRVAGSEICAKAIRGLQAERQQGKAE